MTPTWSHDHAVAALGALVDRLDELGGGLFIEVRPYHRATAEDRRQYVAWLIEHGFRVVLGTRRKPVVMYRAPGGAS